MRNDPRVITLRRQGVCAETGVTLKEGTRALWYPLTRKVFSLESKQATEWRQWSQDVQELNRPW